MVVMGGPAVYLAVMTGLFAENGDVTNDQTRAFLQAYLAKFAAFITRWGKDAA